jgi:hypothetical protein
MPYRTLGSILLALCIAACSSVKDEPLPLSRENIEKYTAAVSKGTRKLEPNVGTVMERVATLYRDPLEKNLGYSFDTTLRYYFVNRASIAADPDAKVFADLITPGAQAVLTNADEALSAGIISTRTRDLLAILSKFRCDHGLLLSNGAWERMAGFMALVSDCEKESGRFCKAGRLIELAVEREIIPAEQMEILAKTAEDGKTGYIRDYLIAHFNLSRWEGARLLIGSDGREIEIASLFDDPEAEFITNERVVYLAEQYEKMVKREKSLLTEKGGAPLRARQSEPGGRS